MARGRKRAASREHVTFEEKLVPSGAGAPPTRERVWRCKFCLGADDGGERHTVTFPASRFDVHITAQCRSAPELVKQTILRRSLSSALKNGAPPPGASYTALLAKTHDAPSPHHPSTAPHLHPHPHTHPPPHSHAHPHLPPLPAHGIAAPGPPAAVGPPAALPPASGTAPGAAPVAAAAGAPPPAKRRKSSVGGAGVGGAGEHARRRSRGSTVVVPPPGAWSAMANAVTRFLVGSALPLRLATTSLFRDLVATLNPPLAAMLCKEPAVWYGQGFDCFYESMMSALSIDVASPGVLRTLCFDHFVEDARLFVNLFESTPGAAMFRQCHPLGLSPEDNTDLADAVEAHFTTQTAAGRPPDPVGPEDLFAGFVGNLGGLRPSSLQQLQAKYPKLFVVGCARHALLRILDSFVAIPQVAWAITEVQAVVRFAVTNGLISQVELRSKLFSSTVSPPGPVLTYHQICLLLEKAPEFAVILGNPAIWASIEGSSTNDAAGTACFQKIVQDAATVKQLTRIRSLLEPVCAALDFIDTNGCPMSWVYPLFTALEADINDWHNAPEPCFNADTLARVALTMTNFWTSGLLNVVHTFSWLMDPFTSPTPAELPEGSRDAMRVVLERMAAKPGVAVLDLLSDAPKWAGIMSELEGILFREGEWGTVVKDCQASLTCDDSVGAATGPTGLASAHATASPIPASAAAPAFPCAAATHGKPEVTVEPPAVPVPNEVTAVANPSPHALVAHTAPTAPTVTTVPVASVAPVVSVAAIAHSTSAPPAPSPTATLSAAPGLLPAPTAPAVAVTPSTPVATNAPKVDAKPSTISAVFGTSPDAPPQPNGSAAAAAAFEAANATEAMSLVGQCEPLPALPPPSLGAATATLDTPVAQVSATTAASPVPQATAPKLPLHTHVVLQKMLRAGDGSRKWRAFGTHQFGDLLFSAAVRTLSMSGISPSVNQLRTGGTAAILGKDFLLGRLSDTSVQRLLFTHVNARLNVSDAANIVIDRDCRFGDFAGDLVAMRGDGVAASSVVAKKS